MVRVHYDGINLLVDIGKLVARGARFEEHPEVGNDTLFKGSVVAYSGNSAEEVRATLETFILLVVCRI